MKYLSKPIGLSQTWRSFNHILFGLLLCLLALPLTALALDDLAFYNRALNWPEVRAIFLAGRVGKQ